MLVFRRIFCSGTVAALRGQTIARFLFNRAKEHAMTTQVIKKTESRTDVAQETSRFTVGVIMTMAGIIGIWAVSCLIGGLASGGFSALIRGFVTAITGN